MKTTNRGSGRRTVPRPIEPRLTNKRGPLATRLHIKEKQDEMFPKVKKAKVDTAALGVELLQHKQELQAEMPIGNEGGPEHALRPHPSTRLRPWLV